LIRFVRRSTARKLGPPERSRCDGDHKNAFFRDRRTGKKKPRRGRRIAKRHFGKPWTILEPGYQHVIAKLNSRAYGDSTRRDTRPPDALNADH
jgi:hypothetical protein